MKKTATIVFAIVIMLASVLPTGAVRSLGIAGGSVAGRAGDCVSVAITLTDNPGITFLRVKAAYNADALTLVGSTNGSILPTMTKSDANNPIALVWSASDNSEANGTLATLKFDIAADAAVGEYGITLTCYECYDENEADIAFTVTSGKVIVTDAVSPGVVGISIRTGAPAGIRFKAAIPKAQRDKTIAKDKYKLVEYGILAKAADNTAALEWYEGANAPVVHGRVAKSVSYSDGTVSPETDFIFAKTTNYNVFTGVLLGLTGHETVDFTFRAYAVYNAGTADAPIYYTAYNDAGQTISIAQVAYQVTCEPYYSTGYPAGSDERAYIDGLAAMYVAP